MQRPKARQACDQIVGTLSVGSGEPWWALGVAEQPVSLGSWGFTARAGRWDCAGARGFGLWAPGHLSCEAAWEEPHFGLDRPGLRGHGCVT